MSEGNSFGVKSRSFAALASLRQGKQDYDEGEVCALMSGQEVEVEERSLVAKGAPLDDGQERGGDGATLRQSRIVKSRSFAALPSLRQGKQDDGRVRWCMTARKAL